MTKIKPPAWTPEEDAELKTLAETMTFGEMERRKKLGRSRSALIARYNRITADSKPVVVKPKSKPRAVALMKMAGGRPSVPLEPVKQSHKPAVPKTIFELGYGDCRYPMDAPKGDAISHLFCGEPALPKSSYCQRHSFCGRGT